MTLRADNNFLVFSTNELSLSQWKNIEVVEEMLKFFCGNLLDF